MSGQIFISYRRDDASYAAGRLYDRLSARFPGNQIFMDVDNLDPGVDFVEAIETSVGSCEVLIAVIGKQWLVSSDEEGRRRLDNPDDFVRLEIAAALKRNIRVIPLLVDGALMPRSNELPDDLKLLIRRNALEVSHTRFNADLGRLVTAIERVLEKADAERKQREEQERSAAEQRQHEQKERLEEEQHQTKVKQSAREKEEKAIIAETAKREQPAPSSKPQLDQTRPESKLRTPATVLIILGSTLAGLAIVWLGFSLVTASHDKTALARSPMPTPTLAPSPTPVPSATLAPSPRSRSPVTPPQSQASATEAAKEKLVVGFSQVGAESGWRTANTESIKSEAQKRGIDLRFSDAQQKEVNQIKAIRSFIAQGVDVIAFSPVVETGFEPVLQEAKKAGIPVVLCDRAVKVSDPSLYVTFLGSDSVEEGRRAANAVAKLTGGKANIAELVGTVGSAPAIDRKKGFEEVLAKYPDMKIIMSQSGDFTRAKGKEVMEAFLKSPNAKEINVLFAHNDDMALGAIQAMEEAGIKPGQDIKIVSIDAVRGAFEAMKDGKLNATVECNPLIGPQLFDLIEKIANKQDVPKRVASQESVYYQSQAAAELPKRQY